MNIRRIFFSACIAALLILSAVPLFAGSVLNQDFGIDSPTPPAWTQPLQPMFVASATKYNIPVELLFTLGFFGSAFENRGDAPTIEGGYGVMALRKNNTGGNSLTLGSQLTGVPEDKLKTDPAANIDAAAAVLDYYAKMWQIDRSQGLEAWLQPVITYAGLDDENSKFFAWEVMKRLQTGTDQINASGERFLIGSVSIGKVDLPSLLPKGAAIQVPDYPLAIWDPAATCNYDSSTHSSDTVVIHDMEGTLAGTRNWFKNCDHGTLGPSSCTYNIGSDGTIVQMVAESQTAWDVGCYNSRSVGIEHEGYASQSSFPKAMYDASALLTRDICNRHGIPKQKTTVGPGIVGHVDVTNCCCGTHTDPGPNWDWNYYITQVNGAPLPTTFDFNWTGARTSEKHNANAVLNDPECSENVDIFYPFNADCSRNAEQWLKWQTPSGLTGRGWFHTDVIVPCGKGVSKLMFRMLKPDGTDKGATASMDECPLNGWQSIYEGQCDMGIGGWRTDTLDWSRCGSSPPACGSDPGGAGRMHMFGDQWKYIDDWTVVGPFTTANTVNDNPAGLDEANLYLYPATDTSHGGALAFGGKTPGRVTTGNCGDGTSSLDYLNKQTAYYGTNAAVYAASWIHVPTTASPKFDIGSDDGCKLWLDQNNFWTNDASRGVAWDQDVTDSVAIGQNASGWHRVLFKIRNGVSGFGGVVSLRKGDDNRWNERSVDLQDFGTYKSYGVAYEQDSWYPTINVTAFNGIANPASGTSVYGTSINASGTAAGQGPVPFWQVMWYKNGYGTGGDTNYAPVTTSGTTWSHTDTTSVGHTRYYFFAVSKSHRASFQDNGATGGSNWTGNGHGTYLDVFVDNVAPQTPKFTSLVALGTDSIQANWDVPLDQGVGIGPGATMDAAVGGDNHYRCGDVGVLVRRSNMVAYNWGTGNTCTATGLMPNGGYIFDIQARDNNSLSRGVTVNTSPRAYAIRYTLSAPPSTSNVTCDKAIGSLQTAPTFTFTAVGGFGSGFVEYYKYAWDTSPTHTFDGTEATWNADDLALTALSTGKYYLHLQGFNHDNVANGTLDLGPYLYSSQPLVSSISAALLMPGTPGMVLQNKAVTAAIPGMFWLEDDNRAAGIGVVSSTAVTEGHLVDVSGSLGPWGAQRVLFADLVADDGPGASPSPVFMQIRSLGGTNRNADTPGVTTSKGLYNLGLLVKIAGTVTYRDVTNSLAKYFYLDDGAGQIDDSGHSGVKVLCGSYDPPAADHVSVVGVISSEQSGLKVVPTIVVTSPDHVTQY